MNGKKNIEKEFRIIKIITIICTLSYTLIDCGLYLLDFLDVTINFMCEKAEEVFTTLMFVWILFPVVVIVSWGAYFNYSVKINYQDRSNKKIVYRNIVESVILGAGAFWSLHSFCTFLEGNENIITDLCDCVLIKICILFIWGICCFNNIRKCRKIPGDGEIYKRRGKYIGVIVMLIVVSLMGVVYTYVRSEDVWFDKMVEYSETYHDGEPFLAGD